MADDEMRDAYRKSHANIVKYLVASGSEPDPPDDAKKLDSKKYEDTLAEHLGPVLQEIDNQLERKYKDKHVEIKKAIIQCNSLHPKVNARLRIPWKMSEKDWKFTRRGETPEILCLLPDRPTHILTEILLRLKPYPNQESANGSRKDWVGILLNTDTNKKLRQQAGDEYYLCPVEWSKEIDINTFSKSLRDQLETFRKKNNKAMVALGKEYPPPEKFHDVTERVFNWFKKHEKTRNAFYLADLVDSEQLAGIATELEIGEKTKISDINDFLKDCQWMMNRYVFSLILEAEKTYSGEGLSYPDAYFSHTKIQTGDNETKTYEMIENLIDLFTPNDASKIGEKKINERYKDCKFNNMGIIENLFKKIRIHFEITKGEMGKYAIGYKKHAYEVACVVAGIMDVLFYDEPGSKTSIEIIVRQCSPGLEGIEKQLKDAKVPFLFRQLFRGLSKEDQLFLIPQYREHFIHSFYVFVFGVSLMSYAPVHVIPKKLRLNEFDDENKVKGLLKEWFMVSMWHDIAYMIEKGNMVLEQHVLSLMRDGRRTKGLLPWLPSLGNLLQVDKLLDEIRELSEGSIKLCPILLETIKGTDIARRLTGDIVIAAAFERRDHGVWSAMMFNHAWESEISEFFSECNKDVAIKKLLEKVINKTGKQITDNNRKKITREAGELLISQKRTKLTYQTSKIITGVSQKTHSKDEQAKLIIKATKELNDKGKKILTKDNIKQTQIQLSQKLRQSIAKAIIPHHLADWDVRKILKDYDYLSLPGNCATEDTINKLSKKEKPSIECKLAVDDVCSNQPVFTIDYESNKLGYLLGICDMLSQAGRENAELPTETGSRLGIKYRNIEVCADSGQKNSLTVFLKYKKPDDMDDDIFCSRYVQPALYLGLKVKQSNTESIMISAGGGSNVSSDKKKCFYLPSLNGEDE